MTDASGYDSSEIPARIQTPVVTEKYTNSYNSICDDSDPAVAGYMKAVAPISSSSSSLPVSLVDEVSSFSVVVSSASD